MMLASGESPLPRLREDLQLMQGAPTITGKPTWLIFDPVAHRYFQIDQNAFRLLSIWNRHSTVSQLTPAAEEALGGVFSSQRIDEMLMFITRNNLSVEPAEGDWRQYYGAWSRRKTSWWKKMAHSYLFFRVPLVRPKNTLQRLLPFVLPFLSRGFLTLAVVVGVLGIYLTSRQWDTFMATFADFYSWQGVAAYLAALVFIKIFHEMAHAFTAARYGCRIPSMGIAFLVMMPVLYTDVTDAWKLRSRRQRLTITGAGMISELVLAAFATFLWAFLPDGTAKSICFVIATTSWVLSLLINLNPFLRFDGYYLMTDAAGIENLQPRAFELGRWKMREWLFNIGAACPENLPRRTMSWMIAYAWMTWVYRFFLFIGIAILVYYLFFKVLGVLLFVIEIAWFILLPIWAELKEWYAMKETILKRRRTFISAGIFTGMIALGLMPLSTTVKVPAVIEANQFERIYPVVPAQISMLNVSPNQRVSKGDVLIELTAPEVDNKLNITAIRMASVQTRLDRAAGDTLDKQQILVLQRELAHLIEEKAGLERQRARLQVIAPFDGKVVDIRPRLHVGRWVGLDEPLLTVASGQARVARGYLSERDLWRIEKGAEGSFIPDDISQNDAAISVKDIAYSNSAKLELPYLASRYDGAITVTGDKIDDLVPAQAQYLVTMSLLEDDGVIYPVQRGMVRVAGKSESLLSGLWRQTLKVLVRESGV